MLGDRFATNASSHFFEIAESRLPGLLSLANKREEQRLLEYLNTEGEALAEINSESVEMLSDLLASEARATLPRHAMLKGWTVGDDFSCCESQSFQKWAKTLLALGPPHATAAMIARAYGFKDPMHIADISQSIEKLHSIVSKIETKDRTVVAWLKW